MSLSLNVPSSPGPSSAIQDSPEAASVLLPDLATFTFGLPSQTKPNTPAPLTLSSAPSTSLQGPPPIPLPTPTFSPSGADDDDGPAVLVHPASPAISAGSFETAREEASPAPVASTSFLPPSPGSGGLAARRMLNKKRLSLVVPAGPAAHGPASPISPSLLAADDALAETRSLPPTPVSLAAYIGTEGSEAQDRTIGRLMLKQQADEMREQMKGGRGMKRRTSIPRLNLAPNGKLPNGKPVPLNLAGSSSSAGMAVQLLRRDSVERSGGREVDGSALEDDEAEDAPEEFPYALGPREILPGIYLGSELNARDPALLKKWGIGAVLNVAKEVECPWVDEVIDEESEAELPPPTPSYYERRRSSIGGKGWEQVETPSPPIRDNSPPPPSTSQPKRNHRRTNTQTAILGPDGAPTRPQFVRPTASTPNLQSAYAAAKTVVVPPLPHGTLLSPIQASPSPSKTDMQIPSPEAVPSPAHAPPTSPPVHRSLSSSPPQPRRSPPRERRATAGTPGPRTGSDVRFTPNKRTGRPELHYLWLKWGHDEADLVEAGKFQVAFDFLDGARAAGQKTLVHCQCGVSRSATVVIAYCMREAAKALENGQSAGELEGVKGMHDTYSFVKEKSEWVGPNLGLVFQLVAYERNLRGANAPDPYGEEDEERPYADHSTLPAETSAPPAVQPIAVEAIRSPRTPLWSEGSTASGSQLSTPEMHEPALSPTLSLSSANSTGGRSARLRAIDTGALGRDEVVILQPDGTHEANSIAGMVETLSLENLATHTAAGSDPSSVKSSPIEPSPTAGPGSPFVLPLPPRAPPRRFSTDDASSPTVSSFRPQPPMLSTRLPFQPGSAQLTPRAAYSTVPRPSLSMNTNLGPAARSGLAVGPLSASASSSSSTVSGLRAFSSPGTDLDADGEPRASRAAFGTQQTAQERRASHRRVFSETISVAGVVKARQAGQCHSQAASPTAVAEE